MKNGKCCDAFARQIPLLNFLCCGCRLLFPTVVSLTPGGFLSGLPQYLTMLEERLVSEGYGHRPLRAPFLFREILCYSAPSPPLSLFSLRTAKIFSWEISYFRHCLLKIGIDSSCSNSALWNGGLSLGLNLAPFFSSLRGAILIFASKCYNIVGSRCL